jgi:hypothetical protein
MILEARFVVVMTLGSDCRLISNRITVPLTRAGECEFATLAGSGNSPEHQFWQRAASSMNGHGGCGHGC